MGLAPRSLERTVGGGARATVETGSSVSVGSVIGVVLLLFSGSGVRPMARWMSPPYCSTNTRQGILRTGSGSMMSCTRISRCSSSAFFRASSISCAHRSSTSNSRAGQSLTGPQHVCLKSKALTLVLQLPQQRERSLALGLLRLRRRSRGRALGALGEIHDRVFADSLQSRRRGG